MMKNAVLNTLQKNELRHTGCREDTLLLFFDEDTALSHGNLEKTLGQKYDRVTIYRTLKTFVEKGILHKVLDEDGLRYALCKEACTDHHHQHDHVHFKCSTCGKTSCLNDVIVPKIQLPNGYSSQEVNLLIQGICGNCEKGNISKV